MKLAIGLVLYKQATAVYLPYLLPSLATALDFLPEKEFKILVGDNSGDLSNQTGLNDFSSANKKFSDNLEYFSFGENLGFGKAYNRLIRRAKELGAEYFLVINPDLVLDKDSIELLLDVLEKKTELAVAAPKIKRWDFAAKKFTDDLDSLGLKLSPGLKFSDLGQGLPEAIFLKENLSIVGPTGAGALFRTSALEKISFERGGQKEYYDEDLFMYKEDCDLAYRLYLADLKTVSVPQAIFYHDRSASSSNGGCFSWLSNRLAKSRQVRSWSFHNQHILYRKYWSKQDFYSRLLIVFRLVIFFIFSLIFERFLLKEYPGIISYHRN